MTLDLRIPRGQEQTCHRSYDVVADLLRCLLVERLPSGHIRNFVRLLSHAHLSD